MVDNYVPNNGDVIWISLGSTLGHEQKGRRPALVITPRGYNNLVRLCLICPITSVIKGYPYEVVLGRKGVILCDQIRSLSWRERKAKYIMTVPTEIMETVLEKIKIFLRI